MKMWATGFLCMALAVPAWAAIGEGDDPGEAAEAAVGLPQSGSAVALPDESELETIEKTEDVALPEEKEGSRLDSSSSIEPPSTWKPMNFILGAVGGALLGGYVGFIQSAGPDGVNQDKLATNLPLYAAGGAVGGGLIGLVLGAMVAPDPTPPSAGLPTGPMLSLGVSPHGAQMGLRLAF